MDHTAEIHCPGCGHVFQAFLQEMAEHNLHVTCPKCGKKFEHRREQAESEKS